jgi:DNA-binding beta-propeller fold protein YncE/phospholipase C
MRCLILFCALIASLQLQGQSDLQNQLNSKRVTLPNGWKLSPHGSSIPLGDLPLNVVVSPNQKYILVTNNGQSIQSLQLIDVASNQVLDSKELPKSWYGLKVAADNKTVFVSGGNDNVIIVFEIQDRQLVEKDKIVLSTDKKANISPAGIEYDDAKDLLYVVTKENNSLYMIQAKTKNILAVHKLPAEAFTCLLNKKKDVLYISVWGAKQILPFQTAIQQFLPAISVGDHPNEMLLTKNGKTMYVANGNDNSVSVVDLVKKKEVEVLNAALVPNALEGSSTNGLALSAGEDRLYISNADNNCLAVFEVEKLGQSKSLGFIPVGWFPTSIQVVKEKLYVANGKGFSSFANPDGPNPIEKKQTVTYQKSDNNRKVRTGYIGGLMKGTMSVFMEPTVQELAVLSKAVYQNTPYTKERELNALGETGNPIPMKVGDASPIKYVFYILKENRTYDQVLSDVTGGNGDTTLLLFGEKYTPNQHKLVKDFVLLDNFYVDGEVSSDGHNWSTSAHATDYLEKTWPTSYGGRGGKYDGEGNRLIANPKNGFIWDYCQRAGISYRTYGEFADNFKPNIPVIANHFCSDFASFDQNVMDTTRFHAWKRDFDRLLAAGQVPRFNSLHFPNDHTEGQRLGKKTPFAYVADNDYAIGLFVEHLSKSSIWKETAIFIVEDDAQNGPDHVDAHRTTAYVAGGFVKRGFVDHTPYSTSSMLRTMELILGLPPMSQYDAAATPMFRSFTPEANLSPFVHEMPRTSLTEINVLDTPSAQKSSKFDFKKEDSIPDLEFSEVIWKAVKGENSVMPAPRRAAILTVSGTDID